MLVLLQIFLKQKTYQMKFIFDSDGTIVDTQCPFHATVEAAILKKRGVIVTPEEISERFAGRATKHVFAELAPGHDVELMYKEKWKDIYILANSKPIHCLPGMYELIDFLDEKKIPIAVASAAPSHWLDCCMRQSVLSNSMRPDIALRHFFGVGIFSAEECKNPKPAPDVFLKAAQYLGGPDDMTYVLGDGRSDVLGGLAAGFEVLYLSTTNTEFDAHPHVKRFNSSFELSEYVQTTLVER